MPEPRLRGPFSRGWVSPNNRLKNSSRGSLEPGRPERCEVVKIFTTTGVVRLAMAAKDGGRFSRAARLAPITGAPAPKSGNDASQTPSIETNKPRDDKFILNVVIGLPRVNPDSTEPQQILLVRQMRRRNRHIHSNDASTRD